MRLRKTFGKKAREAESRKADLYAAPLEVPASYGIDDYPWSNDFVRDHYLRECHGDPEVARTVRDMIALDYWFEVEDGAVVLIGDPDLASEDLLDRMSQYRDGIRRWYLENAHGGLEAA